jgi:hypothetical protein
MNCYCVLTLNTFPYPSQLIIMGWCTYKLRMNVYHVLTLNTISQQNIWIPWGGAPYK